MKYISIFSLVASLLISSNAFAINHQDEIQKAQAWADQFQTSYPILVFDRDEMTFLFASQNALGEKQKSKRIAILKKYIEDKKNITLKDSHLDNIEMFLTTVSNAAIAVPASEPTYNTKPASYEFCSVFPLAPNGNAFAETERLLGMNIKEVYPTEHYDQLTKKMSLEEMYLFSLYHEVGHCVDPQYLPKAQNNPDDAHSIHLAEAFAEVFAYLSIADRVGPKVADARSLYRTIYSKKMGEYLAKQPSIDPNRVYGGVIYYLTPYILNAYERLTFNEITTTAKLLPETALSIVQKNELISRSFTAIKLSLENGMEPTLKRYQEMSFNSPEYFTTPLEDLVNYDIVTSTWIEKAFTQTPALLQTELAPTLPLKDLCASTKSGDKTAYMQTLTNLRDKINGGNFTTTSIRPLFNDLHNLPTFLEGCH